MAQALIVIDMQKALADMDQRDKVIAVINDRINEYRANNLPIIFMQNSVPGMEVASEGWQLFDDLNTLGTDTYFNKTQPDSFYQTGLESFLKMNHLDHIEICGAQVEFCIDTTTRVAFHLGFKIDLLIDGITTMDSATLTAKQIKEHHSQIWKNHFAKLITESSVLN